MHANKGAKIIMPCIIDIYVVINADHIRGGEGAAFTLPQRVHVGHVGQVLTMAPHVLHIS